MSITLHCMHPHPSGLKHYTSIPLDCNPMLPSLQIAMLCPHPSGLQCYAPIPPDCNATPNKRLLSHVLSFPNLISVIPSVDWSGNMKEEEAVVLTAVMAGTTGAELWHLQQQQWCRKNRSEQKQWLPLPSSNVTASQDWPFHAQWGSVEAKRRKEKAELKRDARL